MAKTNGKFGSLSLDTEDNQQSEKYFGYKKAEKNQGEKFFEILENVITETEFKNNGQANFKRISKEYARKAAEEYGEGCESLTNFLEACILNEIHTTSSCAGHPERDKNYSCVDFDISDEKAKKMVEFIVKNKLADNIWIRKIKKSREKEKCILGVYVNIDKRDLLYNTCTKNIREIIKEDKIGKHRGKEINTESLIRRLITISEKYQFKKDGLTGKQKYIAGGYIDYNIQTGEVETYEIEVGKAILRMEMGID